MDEGQMNSFYSSHKVDGLLENEYLILKDTEETAVDYYIYQKGELVKLSFPCVDSITLGKIKPRNEEQYLVMSMLRDRKIPVKIIRGVFGSGKDFLMSAYALNLVQTGSFNKIVYLRPNVIVKDVPDVGFLPGDIYDKLAWTLGPLVDKFGGEDYIQSLIRQEKLELVPFPYIRGRSFDNSIVYVSEAQNMTLDTFKLLISRVGENSELWVNADNHQVDKQIYEKSNGVVQAIDKLKGNTLVGYVYLSKTERGVVANLANLLD